MLNRARQVKLHTPARVHAKTRSVCMSLKAASACLRHCQNRVNRSITFVPVFDRVRIWWWNQRFSLWNGHKLTIIMIIVLLHISIDTHSALQPLVLKHRRRRSPQRDWRFRLLAVPAPGQWFLSDESQPSIRQLLSPGCDAGGVPVHAIRHLGSSVLLRLYSQRHIRSVKYLAFICWYRRCSSKTL